MPATRAVPGDEPRCGGADGRRAAAAVLARDLGVFGAGGVLRGLSVGPRAGLAAGADRRPPGDPVGRAGGAGLGGAGAAGPGVALCRAWGTDARAGGLRRQSLELDRHRGVAAGGGTRFWSRSPRCADGRGSGPSGARSARCSSIAALPRPSFRRQSCWRGWAAATGWRCFPRAPRPTGRRVLPFKSSLFGVFFAPGLEGRVAVQPVIDRLPPARRACRRTSTAGGERWISRRIF